MTERKTKATAAKSQTKPKAEGKEIEGIRVRTVRGANGFRRAGFSFDEAGYGIALDALTEAQLAAIEAEPKLIVERCTFGGGELEAGK